MLRLKTRKPVAAMTSKKLKKIIEDDKNHLFQNYGNRLPVCFVRGKDSYLFDQDNRKYIDFFSGIAVSNLGYGHKELIAALRRQVGTLIHTSNWYFNREQNEAAKLITQLSFPGKTLFVNSGAEANEAAIKLARAYGISQQKNRHRIITFTNSFHGRTFGSMSATAQAKIHSGFGPLVPGFIYLPFGDIKQLSRELKRNRKVCAVMLELIQGEGGIHLADKKYVKELFQLCRKRDVLVIIDEVQTGIGRTGKAFGYQHYGVVPDIITLAKGLAGGMPVGAIHAKNYLVPSLGRGTHGTTFGGNHVTCAAVCAVLQELKKKSLLGNVNRVSDYLFKRLCILKEKTGFIKEVRGMGLHIGIELDRPGAALVTRALEMGLVINCTAERVIRIMPPLNISLKTVKEGMAIFEKIFLEELETSDNSKSKE
jgi:predicted acetylornithine/succinylornithine family transaminase